MTGSKMTSLSSVCRDQDSEQIPYPQLTSMRSRHMPICASEAQQLPPSRSAHLVHTALKALTLLSLAPLVVSELILEEQPLQTAQLASLTRLMEQCRLFAQAEVSMPLKLLARLVTTAQLAL